MSASSRFSSVGSLFLLCILSMTSSFTVDSVADSLLKKNSLLGVVFFFEADNIICAVQLIESYEMR